MALIDSEGFGLSTTIGDYYTYSAWRDNGVLSSTGSIVTGGPLGDNFVYPAGTTSMRRVVPSTPSAIIVGFRAAFSSQTSSYLYFRDGSGLEQCRVKFSPTGTISIVAANGTVLAGPTTAGTVPGTAQGAYPGTPFAWVYTEISAVISTTVGSVSVRVNGVTVLTVSGVNTNNAGAGSTINLIDWGNNYNAEAATMPNGLTHIYLCDTTGAAPWNTFLGDVRVQTLRPTANDAVQFTPVGLASNWQNAALALPVPGTDYNSNSTVGDQDTFVIAPADAGFATIHGVHVKPLIAKSDAGTRFAAAVLKSGATTSVGTPGALAVTSRQVSQLYQLDPNTGAAWTLANASAIKAGYKVTA